MIASQRVRAEVTGPMTGSAKQSNLRPRDYISELNYFVGSLLGNYSDNGNDRAARTPIPDFAAAHSGLRPLVKRPANAAVRPVPVDATR
ncbi:MAG: hypothetical protein ABSD08_21105 [Xanthobacteraceae bacterium]|jgi:hypothetical protein